MSSITINGDTSGSVILQAPAVSGSTTLTLPTTSGTVLTTTSGQWITTGSDIYYNTGNVGIGTASPSTKTSISGPMFVAAANFKGVLSVNSTDSQATGNGAGITLGGVFTGTAQTAFAQIAGIKENSTDANYAGALAMYYRPNGDTLREGMRIDSSGRLLLAGTSAIAGYQFTMYHTDQGGMAYKYNGTSEQNSCSFQNGNGQVGRIYTSNVNTTYSTSSDYRLKENVVPMTGALDKVAQLNPVTYTWKTDGSAGQGFIAHELQAVVPDCVGGTKDAVDEEGNPIYQDIDTSFLVATLTAAIKELKAELDELKAKIG